MKSLFIGLLLGLLSFGSLTVFSGCATTGGGCTCATTMPGCKCDHCKSGGEGTCPCAAHKEEDHTDHKH